MFGEEAITIQKTCSSDSNCFFLQTKIIQLHVRMSIVFKSTANLPLLKLHRNSHIYSNTTIGHSIILSRIVLQLSGYTVL